MYYKIYVFLMIILFILGLLNDFSLMQVLFILLTDLEDWLGSKIECYFYLILQNSLEMFPLVIYAES